MLYFWIILFITLAILEICTATLVSVWFLPGALISGILAFFDLQIWLQIAVFCVLSVVLLIFTKPLTDRLTHTPHTATNADRVIGEIALVTEEINAAQSRGAVKVLGKTWSARTEEHDITVREGATVRVLRMEGVYLIVAPIEA